MQPPNNQGFFDDEFDDEAETRFDHNRSRQPPAPQPPPAYGGYDESEDVTLLPNRSSDRNNYGRGNYDEADSATTYIKRDSSPDAEYAATQIGEEDMEIKPIGFLIVKRPLYRRGHVYKIGELCTIGRAKGHIKLADDMRVTAEGHARIRLGVEGETGEQAFFIGDLMSKTGTRINDKPIDRVVRLNEGDEIKIGEHVFVFKMLAD